MQCESEESAADGMQRLHDEAAPLIPDPTVAGRHDSPFSPRRKKSKSTMSAG